MDVRKYMKSIMSTPSSLAKKKGNKPQSKSERIKIAKFKMAFKGK